MDRFSRAVWLRALFAILCVAPGAAAMAQSAPTLRGAITDVATPLLKTPSVDESLDVQGSSQTRLQKPRLRIVKPKRVTRIGQTKPAQALPSKAETVPSATSAISEPLDAPEAAPTQSRRKAEEEDPYAALGWRTGAFLLKPSIDVDFGFDDNPARSSNASDDSAFLSLRPSLLLESQWSRHSLRGAINGGYTHYLSGAEEDRPSLSATLEGSLDARRDLVFDGALRFSYDTEKIDQGTTPTATESRSPVLAYGATLGATKTFGKLSLGIRGTVDRSTYEDISLSGGGVQAAADRNLTSFGTTLRASYAVSEAFSPFMEVAADQRVYDNAATLRDSVGYSVRAGVAFAPAGPISGEASIGYGLRTYDDPALPNIDGVLANASLLWQATGLTSIRLTASTSFNETTSAGSSGSTVHTVGADVTHAFRRHLIGTAGLSYSVADYAGISRNDDTITANAGIEYKMSRSVSLRVRATHERFASSVPGTDYTANTLIVGLRLQH